LSGEDLTVRVICIGAHPDDCEIEFGGTAAKLAARGDAVKFLSVTDGQAGHHQIPGPDLALIRRAEAREAAHRLGIAESEVLANHDAQLVPSLAVRNEIVGQIRAWHADVVITHRPSDYHPDHRYTGQIVQDSAYLVTVPYVAPEQPALCRNPVFLYLEDAFRLPAPFAPDVAVDIDDVWEQKLDALDAHRSQVYEWLPWVEGYLAPAGRADLDRIWSREPSVCARAALARRYGADHASRVRHCEAFQICEYGRRPSAGELDEIFPR
jgi:LmbE family N-acetylglucosaminyl deacetylase